MLILVELQACNAPQLFLTTQLAILASNRYKLKFRLVAKSKDSLLFLEKYFKRLR